MRAAFIQRFGGVEVLEVGEQPCPRPRKDEVLIKVHASSINPRDWLIRSGRYPFQALLPRLPLILGSDVAGVVADRGAKVHSLALGQPVFAMQPTRKGFGAYAEYVAIPARAVAPKPEALSFEEAAGIPLAGLTAYQALVANARLTAGQRIVVIGASGGVGTYAVQIARALGARVTGVCSEKNLDLVRELGAEKVVNYQRGSFLDSDDRYDVVFDVIGKESLERCSPILEGRGVYVTTIPRQREMMSWASSALRSRLGGRGPRSSVVLVRSDGPHLRQLGQWAEEGKLRTVIDRVLPLQDIAAAHEHSRSFRTRGKLILSLI